jgi:hypothetical protein
MDLESLNIKTIIDRKNLERIGIFFLFFFSNTKKRPRGEISIRNKSMVRNNKNQELA